MSKPKPEDSWRAVDDYIAGLFGLQDMALDRALIRSGDAGLPAIQVSPAQGALLGVLVRALKARVVLEIGTLGGFSTIFLARGLPTGGRVLSLELEPHHAEVARANLHDAGLADRVQVLVGPALETLGELRRELHEPVDLVFIDADKPAYSAYLAAVLPLCRAGTVIVADNVVRSGAVAVPDSGDDKVEGVRRFLDALARQPGLSTTVIQTVGCKGHDGLSISVVTE